jgi:chromosome segregation ATPase
MNQKTCSIANKFMMQKLKQQLIDQEEVNKEERDEFYEAYWEKLKALQTRCYEFSDYVDELHGDLDFLKGKLSRRDQKVHKHKAELTAAKELKESMVSRSTETAIQTMNIGADIPVFFSSQAEHEALLEQLKQLQEEQNKAVEEVKVLKSDTNNASKMIAKLTSEKQDALRQVAQLFTKCENLKKKHEAPGRQTERQRQTSSRRNLPTQSFRQREQPNRTPTAVSSWKRQKQQGQQVRSSSASTSALGNKNFSKSLRRTKAKSRKDSPGWISP